MQQAIRQQLLMHFPQHIYLWLVENKVISNQGQLDAHGQVYLPNHQSNQFINGFLVAELIKTLTSRENSKANPSLLTIKSDNSKSTKLTNWNFIWLALPQVGLQLDGRLKQLILQGQNTLIVDLIRQLHDNGHFSNSISRLEGSSITIKSKTQVKSKTNTFDVKKINFGKDPEQSESALQFLILLLKSSLGMQLEEILGLFTNQNKFLAHLIIKGISDNFQPVILFYTLLNKHVNKLKQLLQTNHKDAEASFHAIKPGFTSKSTRVTELTLELFEQLDGLYEWFVSEESKCLNTFFLGLRRHSELRNRFWDLLMKITKENQLEFYTTYYSNGFDNDQELVDISSYMLRHIASCSLRDDMVKLGIISVWIQTAVSLPAYSIENQITAFHFIGELMLELPQCVEQTCILVLGRDWLKRSLPDYVTLINELIIILQKLASHKSPMSKEVYSILCIIVQQIGSGDKRDYLVECFTPIISLFPTIPSQQFISHLKGSSLSPSQLLLICQAIQNNSSFHTLTQIGSTLKKIFIQNPLVNSFIAPLLTQIVKKTMRSQEGMVFFSNLVEQALYGYAVTFLKYRPKHIMNNQQYFGKKGNPSPVNKEEVLELKIGQRWKDIYLGLAQHLLKMTGQYIEPMQIIKQKLIKVNNYIKFHNSKLPSKELSKILWDKFKIEDKHEVSPSEIINTVSEVDFIEKIQTKTTEERRIQQAREAAVKEKKYLEFRKKKINKEMQSSNLVRGQVNEAQIHEDGFLQLMIHQPEQLHLVPFDELEQRDIDSIDCVLKRYHKVLRHLFLLYTGTRHHSQNTPQLLEDISKRKETLTVVELIQILKDYGKYYLTSRGEVTTMLRDINVKLLKKRNIQELDFQGFQMFIVQFCYHNMTIPHQITTNTISNNQVNRNSQKVEKVLKGQPIGVIMTEFFKELKGTFISKGQRIDIFQDVEDFPMTNQQSSEVSRLNKELESNPHFILPTGYKKITETIMNHKYELNCFKSNIPEAYLAALEAVDYIFSKASLNMHVIEDNASQQVKSKAKAVALISPDKLHRQRAMSTLISRNKSPLLFSPVKDKSKIHSKALAEAVRQITPKSRAIAQQVALCIEQMIDKVAGPVKVDSSRVPPEKKEPAKPKRRAVSSLKLKEDQERIQALLKMKEQKEEAKKREMEKQKQEQRRRRQHIAKFLDEQKVKMLEKKQKQEQQRQRKIKEEQAKNEGKKTNMQKFKAFHKDQLEKIKKIEHNALQKKKIEQDSKVREKEKSQSLHRNLKQKIQGYDRHRIELRKEAQQNFNELLSSETTKQIFNTYEPNLKALFKFLVNHTHNSLTQKKHNNEVVYDTWLYFNQAFELSPIIVDPKELVYIFKNMTKHKIISKEFMIGLSFKQFQQALFIIAVKYKGVFNMIGDRIVEMKAHNSQLSAEQVDEFGIEDKSPRNDSLQGGYNQFHSEVDIKQLVKENNEGKDQLNQYGDLSKVTDKTLKGLIHYLKVPKSKTGQERRFKQILNQKKPIYTSNAERLKEKLTEDFSMPESPKRTKKNTIEENMESSEFKVQ